MNYISKLYALAGLVTLSASLHSCSDYLDETSGDLLIPEKVNEFQSVLYGDGYPNSFTYDADWMDMMTDDVAISPECDPFSGTAMFYGDSDDTNLISGEGAFCWAQNVEYYMTGYSSAYQNRYKNIMACNAVIEAENTMTGEQGEIDACLAQAYTLRAFSYFCLINWYGMPYNEATAETDMGVIIRLKSEVVRDEPKRASVAQTYKQINSDLDKALQLFETATQKKSLFVVSKRAALLLKTRVALYTKQWDDVISYGNILTEDGFVLYDLSTKSADDFLSSSGFLSSQNTEIIFSFSEKSEIYPTYMNFTPLLGGATFVPSQSKEGDLLNSYEDGDNRIYAFFKQNNTDDFWYTDYRQICYKHEGYATERGCYTQAFRMAEALLNMAEAYIQKGTNDDCAKAIDLLNELRKARFAQDAYTALSVSDFASTKELLDFAWAERRRELCFEETHRWLDLRRQGMPRIVHQYQKSKNAVPETYILEAKDVNYTLALPKIETSYNSQVEVYDRRINKAQ